MGSMRREWRHTPSSVTFMYYTPSSANCISAIFSHISILHAIRQLHQRHLQSHFSTTRHPPTASEPSSVTFLYCTPSSNCISPIFSHISLLLAILQLHQRHLQSYLSTTRHPPTPSASYSVTFIYFTLSSNYISAILGHIYVIFLYYIRLQ